MKTARSASPPERPCRAGALPRFGGLCGREEVIRTLPDEVPCWNRSHAGRAAEGRGRSFKAEPDAHERRLKEYSAAIEVIGQALEIDRNRLGSWPFPKRAHRERLLFLSWIAIATTKDSREWHFLRNKANRTNCKIRPSRGIMPSKGYGALRALRVRHGAFAKNHQPNRNTDMREMLTSEVLALAQLYRDRADSENPFDELKNHRSRFA